MEAVQSQALHSWLGIKINMLLAEQFDNQKKEREAVYDRQLAQHRLAHALHADER